MSDDYSVIADYYNNRSTDADDAEGMSVLDPVKRVAADVAGEAASYASAGQVAAEQSNSDNLARIMRGVSMGLHRGQEAIEGSMTEAGRRAGNAAVLPDEGQEQLGSHPFREIFMKGAGLAVPIAVGSLGFLAGGPMGTAGAGGFSTVAHGIDQAIAHTNDLSDEDLARESPRFAMYLTQHLDAGHSDEEAARLARKDLHADQYTWKQGFLDATTGAAVYAVGGETLGGKLGGGLVDYLLKGGAKSAAVGAMSSGASNIGQQEAENAFKGQEPGKIDPASFGRAMANGGLEFALLHAANAPFRDRGLKDTGKDKEEEKPAETKTEATAAPGTGVAPKGARADPQPKPTEENVSENPNPSHGDQEHSEEKKSETETKVTGEVTTAPPSQEKPRARRGRKPKVAVPEAPVLGADATQAAALAPEAAPEPAPEATSEVTPPASEAAAPPEAAAAPKPVDMTPADAAPPFGPKTEVPEGQETYESQIKALEAKQKAAVRFVDPKHVPTTPRPKGVIEFKAEDGTVWWYRTGKGGTSKEKIKQAVANKTENEVLGLGPFNKEDVAADVAKGGKPVAVVARDENGTQHAAAASTDNLAPITAKVMQEENPGKPISFEDPNGVIAERKPASYNPESGRVTLGEHQLALDVPDAAAFVPNGENRDSTNFYDKSKRRHYGRRGEAYLEEMDKHGVPKELQPYIEGHLKGTMTPEQIVEHYNASTKAKETPAPAKPKGRGKAKVDEVAAKKGKKAAEEAPKEDVFDEAAARAEVEESLRTAEPKVGPDGRRILPPAPTEENIRAGVEHKRAEWDRDQRVARETAAKAAREEADRRAEEKNKPTLGGKYTSTKNPGRDAQRAEASQKANDITKQFAPAGVELSNQRFSRVGLRATYARVQAMLKAAAAAQAEHKAAKKEGVIVPRELDYEKHTQGQALLTEAQTLVRMVKKAGGIDKVNAHVFEEFAGREYHLRGDVEDYHVYKQNRRAEGDAAKGVKFDETRAVNGKQKSEGLTGELEHGTGDEFSHDDRENETQAEHTSDYATSGGEELTAEERDAHFKKTLEEAPEPEKKSLLELEPKAQELIEKLKAMRDDKAAAENEKLKAEQAIENIEGKVVDRFVTKGSDKSGKFAVEQVKRRRAAANKTIHGKEPVSRPHVTQERRVVEENHGWGGEREGHVSLDYGSDVPSGKIEHTMTVAEMFKDVRIPIGGLHGALFPIIRRRILQAAGDVKVHFVDGADVAIMGWVKHKDDLNGTVEAFYKPKQDGEGGYIVMSRDIPKSDMGRVFTHEALHAATEEALRADPRFKEAIWNIMDEVEAARPDLVEEYGFTNASEFIAEAFSNRKFQDALAQVKVSSKLAKQLGLEKSSVWKSLVSAIRNALGMEPGHYSALEALVRPTGEAMRLNRELAGRGEGAESRPFIRKERVDKARRGAEDIGVNLRNLARRAGRALSSNEMLGQMAFRHGKAFGELASSAVEQNERMAVRVENLIQREGGSLELARRGAELVRKNEDAFKEGADIAFTASEYNLTPGKDADNSHLFGTTPKSDKTVGWQAKRVHAELTERWERLQDEAPEVAEYFDEASKFFREEDNLNRLETIRSVLKNSDINEPGLAEKIFEDGLTDADIEKHFKTDKIVKHINEIRNLKRLKGWYFPMMREGDHVVSARREVEAPKQHNALKIDENTIQFIDPRGKGGDKRARTDAHNFVEDHEMRHTHTEHVWVDKNDPSKIIDSSDPDAIHAYRVKLDNEYMSLHKTEAEAARMAETLRSQGWDAYHDVRAQNPNARWDGMMPSQMQTLIRSLSGRKKFQKLSEAQQAELIQSLRQSAIKLLPGTRLQQRNLQRKGTAGYSKDIVNAIASYGRSSAAFRARTEMRPEISATLSKMQDMLKDRSLKDVGRMREIYQELETRLMRSDFSEPGFWGKAAQTLAKVSMIDKLAGPSFHFINIQEPWTTAMPIIGGRHGVMPTIKTMSKAYDLLGARGALKAGWDDTLRAFRRDDGFMNYRALFEDQINKSGHTAEEKANMIELLRHMHDTNIFGHEAGMEMQRLSNPTGNIASRALDRADLVSRQMGQAIEAINRAVVGLSEYQLEYKKNGGNHTAAMARARMIVHDTMGNYSASNAAPMFNHPFGKVALQFKKFAQKSYFLLGKLMKGTVERDPEAAKQLLGLMFTHGVVAGGLGMPLLEPVKLAVIGSNALGMTNYSWDDFEYGVRDTATQLFGKTGGMAATRGIPRAFLGYDAAGRQGWADLLSGMGPRSNKPGDIKNYLFDEIAGPAYSMPAKWVEGVQALVGGDYEKAFDNLVPIKAARDVARAATGFSHGRENKSGREMMTPYSPMETAIQAMGLNPARRSEEAEFRSHFISADQDRFGTRKQLMDKWMSAKDGQGKNDAWSSIKDYNRDLPGDAKITMKDLQSALKRRKTEDREGGFDRGMRVNKRNKDLHDQMQRVYGGQ